MTVNVQEIVHFVLVSLYLGGVGLFLVALGRLEPRVSLWRVLNPFAALRLVLSSPH